MELLGVESYWTFCLMLARGMSAKCSSAQEYGFFRAGRILLSEDLARISRPAQGWQVCNSDFEIVVEAPMKRAWESVSKRFRGIVAGLTRSPLVLVVCGLNGFAWVTS